jgi:hypothetical protein
MTSEADIEVICPGVLEVLSVGKGDLKLTWDDTPDDVEKARSVIEEMLRKGYSIFVETDVGPARVKRFSPTRMTYVITELAVGNELPTGPSAPAALTAGAPVEPDEVITPKKATRSRKKTQEREIPVAGSKARAVGRTAGG